jgi:hypothetical protein
MKIKTIILSIVVLLSTYTYSLNAQNIFMIGDASYVSTEIIELRANSEMEYEDLKVVIAKDGDAAMLILSRNTGGGVYIKGKVLIYLDDATVITCIDKGKYDLVNDVTTTIFYLTTDELNKMKNSNLNTIRYTIKCGKGCIISTEEGDFSATNKGEKYQYGKVVKYDVPSMIKKLFN